MSNVRGSGDAHRSDRPTESKDLDSIASAGKKDIRTMKDAMKGDKKDKGNAENQGEFAKGGAIGEAIKRGASREALLGKNIKQQKLMRDKVVGDAVQGAAKDKSSKGDAKPSDASIAAAASASASAAAASAAAGALGNASSAQAASAAQGAGATQEMAELANQMTDRILATDARDKLNSGQEVRMTFGDSNPNLKGVEVALRMEKGPDGNALMVNFANMSEEASNYINQNVDALTEALEKEKMDDLVDINVDVGQQDSEDTNDRGNQQSRGEYIPEPDEE